MAWKLAVSFAATAAVLAAMACSREETSSLQAIALSPSPQAQQDEIQGAATQVAMLQQPSSFLFPEAKIPLKALAPTPERAELAVFRRAGYEGKCSLSDSSAFMYSLDGAQQTFSYASMDFPVAPELNGIQSFKCRKVVFDGVSQRFLVAGEFNYSVFREVKSLGNAAANMRELVESETVGGYFFYNPETRQVPWAVDMSVSGGLLSDIEILNNASDGNDYFVHGIVSPDGKPYILAMRRFKGRAYGGWEEIGLRPVVLEKGSVTDFALSSSGRALEFRLKAGDGVRFVEVSIEELSRETKEPLISGF